MDMRFERIRPAYLNTALEYSLYFPRPHFTKFLLKTRKGRLQKRVIFAGNSQVLLANRACYLQLALLTGNSRLLLATRACYRHFAPATGDARSQQATRACYWQFAPVTGKSRLLLATRLFQATRACYSQLAPVTGRLQKRAVSPLMLTCFRPFVNDG